MPDGISLLWEIVCGLVAIIGALLIAWAWHEGQKSHILTNAIVVAFLGVLFLFGGLIALFFLAVLPVLRGYI